MPQRSRRDSAFQPKFDADGLIPAIVSDAASGAVLMFAWMNAEALALTIETRAAHFWSRSKKRLWRKGEESGNTLDVVEMRVDCDQDAILIKVKVQGQRRRLSYGRDKLLLPQRAARRGASTGCSSRAQSRVKSLNHS